MSARDEATVVLPRWFVVLLVSVLTAAGGAFLRLDLRLNEIEVRLAVIESRLGIVHPIRSLPDSGLQIAPPVNAAGR